MKPMRICKAAAVKDKKYPRNYLLFNLCIVCHPWSRTVQFEPIVRKLSQFFVNLGMSIVKKM